MDISNEKILYSSGNNISDFGVIIDKFENKYEGSIMNNKANGKGIKYYKDGRKFEGEFKNGKR